MTKFLGDLLPPQFVDISANTAAGMVATEMKASLVIAGRGARACDMCGKERARWYCAADEAYLCERCDESVHSANAVAKRHERARIGPNGAPLKVKASSNQSHKVKSKDSTVITASLIPIEAEVQKWCNTSRKRSRSTRRCANVSGHSFFSSTPPSKLDSNTSLIKAEKDDTSLLLFDLLSSDDRLLIGHHSGVGACEVKSEPFSPSSTLTSKDRPERKVEGADLTQEVPIYEPLLQDLIDSSEEDLMEKLLPSSPSVCDVSCGSRASTTTSIIDGKETFADNWKISKQEKSSAEADENLQLYDLVDSSAGDMNEGISVNEDSDIDTFDVMDLCSNANFVECVKMEEVNEEFPNADVWNSKYRYDQEACVSIFEGNPFKGKGERDLELSCMDAQDGVKRLQQCLQQSSFHRPLSLHLNFEEVMNAWSDRGSLWLDGQRPQVVPDISLISHGIAECGMIMMAESNCNSTCSQAGQVPSMVVIDKGREARVLRYKEKRRTRLFSKRIRYEVRKLNAERRPRMKGRFVKRAAAIAAM